MPVERIQAASDGLNTDASPDYVGKAQAPYLENLLPRDGKVTARGPITNASALGASQWGPRGMMTFTERAAISGGSDRWRVLLGFRDDIYDSAKPFKTKANMYQVDATTGTVASSGSAPDPQYAPTTRSAQMQSSGLNGMYAFAFGGQDGSETRRWLLRWHPGLGVTPERYLNGATPCGPYLEGHYGDVKVHLSRLFTLGARLDGTTAEGPRTIRWSDQFDAGDVVDTTHENWKDDVSGLYNKLFMPGDDLPVAFGRVGRSLAVFCEHSIWSLVGDAPSAFALRAVTDNVRVFDARGVCDVEDGCFFLCDRGLAYFDGVSMQPMSGGLQFELGQAVERARADWINNQTGYASIVYLKGGHLLVTVGTQPYSPVTPVIYFAGIYDIRRRTWTRFSTPISTGAAPVLAGQVGDVRFATDGRAFYRLDSLTTPELAAALEDDDPYSANGLRYTLKWYTRLARLAAPTLTAKIRRLFLDYRFDSGLTSGWNVKAVDGLGNTIMAEQPVADTPAGRARTRAIFDVNGEASDLQVQARFDGAWTAGDDLVAAELHDVNIAFDGAQQRASGF